ncbi:MAG: DUF350 domain-containing protein [Deltaproteobacteria bacterium]|nr:DUF350 domain-containing protein [Deltaproteobacteria bacterium]MBW2053581.1 DUF350 domain-containing protein [Deltaproteobacteria bacterium]MBW2142119.1 DUF350 domain-containing protein [Deltaproteobacteria bacterium]
MTLDSLVTAIILIIGFYILFYIGKTVNNLLHREYRLGYELVERDNAALALAIVGYYVGLVLAIGGAIVGPSSGLVNDLIDLAVYGVLGIILLNISWYLCDKLILYKFHVSDELIRDHNQGTGAVSAAVSIASGFIIYGSVAGEGGSIWTVLVFWLIGQVILILTGLVYNRITSYDIHEQIEKDNVAAGVSFAGALLAVGVIVGLAGEGDFVSWSENLFSYLAYAVIGLILLPVVRILTDRVLLPTVRLSDEIVAQEKPNMGAAYIEAFSYIAAAFIIFWCV